MSKFLVFFILIIVLFTGPVAFGEAFFLDTIDVYSSTGIYPGLTAHAAIDKDLHTSWKTIPGNDPQWLYVDLGSVRQVDRLTLHWDYEYAEQYGVYYTNDPAQWNLALEITDGNGGLDEIKGDLTCRYIGIYLTKPAIGTQYSLFECEVYGPASTSTPTPHPTIAPDPFVNFNADWYLQSADDAGYNGAQITDPAYSTGTWYPISLPATVLAALVANNVYPNPYFGKNLDSIPDLKEDWWYRKTFIVPDAADGDQYWIDFTGINYRAEVWLNGQKLVDNDEMAGTYRSFKFNITEQITSGRENILAVKVSPPRDGELDVAYVDWNPVPPDKNTGIWNNVYVKKTKGVCIDDIGVTTDLNLPELDGADLTIYAGLTNPTGQTISGILKGQIEAIHFEKPVVILPGESVEVAFNPFDFSQLTITNPRIWWPIHMGDQPLYNVTLTFVIQGEESDVQTTHFGIRTVEKVRTPQGESLFKINGKPLLIRGGGYTWDMMVRFDRTRQKTEIEYVKDMNLNVIRLEGKMGNQYLYDLCDENGILIMAGWCCCSHWERWYNWDDEDLLVARESTRTQIKGLRNHPSAFVWLHGSDYPPPDSVKDVYNRVLQESHWQNPTLTSATEAENSGVKMNGPYDWVAPVYWTQDKTHGGAWSFNTEAGPGPAIPPVESLKKMLPEDKLWPQNDYWTYHAGRSNFNNTVIHDNALNRRYGAAGSLDEYVMKAQLMAYEGIRAMFEAFGRERYTATGIIQWMLNDAWPSTIWHLYDYYLKQGGGYFGAKKGCEPLHIQYSYDTNDVIVTNAYHREFKDLNAQIIIYSLDGIAQYQDSQIITIGPDHVVALGTLPQIPIEDKVFFLKLNLADSDGVTVSSNLYWLSNTMDKHDYGSSTWFHTPVNTFADFTGLNGLDVTTLDVTHRIKRVDDEYTGTVSLINRTNTPAFFTRVTLTDGKEGPELIPVFYEDNYITLFPGESITLTVRFNADVRTPWIEVHGFNVVVSSWPVLAISEQVVSAGKKAEASSTCDSRYLPAYACDNNDVTFWKSEARDRSEWFYIDLEEVIAITEVSLDWTDKPPRDFGLYLSDDAKNWRLVYTNATCIGGLERIFIETSTRYVGIYGTHDTGATSFGIKECKVYAPDKELSNGRLLGFLRYNHVKKVLGKIVRGAIVMVMPL